MHLSDDKIRQALAAEFVLGTLSPRVRRRFQHHLRYDVQLRRIVEQWQQRIDPMASALPDKQPPERVWRAIAARLHAPPLARTTANSAATAGFWRRATLALGVIVLVIAAYLVQSLVVKGEAPEMLAVLSDERAEAALLVAWSIKPTPTKTIKVRVVTHPQMPPDTSWELWLIPARHMDKPISAGFVGMSAEQTITVRGSTAEALAGAWGFAVSVEPKGGSPTGAPTGQVLFKGPCIKIAGI
jgi:anti-sigma-K factor RskA